MFNGANSKAPDSARPRTAHLDATYGMRGRRAAQPLDHDMLVIEPPPAAVIGSTATRFPRNVPVRLTSITLGPKAKDLEGYRELEIKHYRRRRASCRISTLSVASCGMSG